jgi:hypothetical protein
LYSRNENIIPRDERSHIPHKDIETHDSWGNPKSFEIRPYEMTKKNNSFFNKFLLISLILFIASLIVSLFIFFGGINLISSSNVDIKATSPSSVSSGEEYLMVLNIVNENRADMEDVALIVDYPVGSKDTQEPTKVLTHQRIELGTISKGQSKDYSIRALLFGEKDTIKTFILNLEYRVKGSNATLLKEKTVDVSVGSSPILMEVEYPKEVNSGQELKIVINLTSNSPVTLKNSTVSFDYPYGFTYKSSNYKPVRDNSVWNIGDLKDGEKKSLEIVGVLVGQNMEDRSFRISAGTQSTGQIGDSDSDLAESSITIGIRKSFFDLQVSTTNSSVKKIGEFTPITIKWHNTLPEKINNSKIEAYISGNIVDRNNVSVGNLGFYESVNNLVFWDKNSVKELVSMLPGTGGQVSFSLISLTDQQTVRSTRNPNIKVRVLMSGQRSDEDQSVVSSTQDFLVKIQSTLSVVAKSLRKIGPFSNSGPVPPKADVETTYTVSLAVTNTTNDLKDAEIQASIPLGVSWKGEYSPSSEKISYDPDTRIITWKIGNISAGTGFSSSPKEVFFKLGIIPSINQIGSSAKLLSKTTATAYDNYTETQIGASAEIVNTQYSDPDFGAGDSVVTK